MDLVPKTIILKNPDGTIQIGVQPWFKNKKVLVCYNCKKQIIFEASYTQIVCSQCQTHNKVPP